MSYKGTIRGRTIELDEPIAYDEGTRVEVTVSPEPPPRKGSPKVVLQLAGTLSYDEAEAILKAAEGCRQIDKDLWKGKRCGLTVEDWTKRAPEEDYSSPSRSR